MIVRRASRSALFAAVLLMAAAFASGSSPVPSAEHPVVGRFAITSQAGGAVWTFQPSGALFVTGPGDILAEGSWTPVAAEGEFDAQVEMTITDQELMVLGQVHPDGDSLAIYVVATDPGRPDDWTPWPPESRLIGERSGMIAEPSASPSTPPPDCARPAWVAGGGDWDRCDATPVSAS